jgi:hypothetical protein
MAAWYFHGIRARWKNPPTILVYSGGIAFILLILLELFFFFNLELVYSDGVWTELMDIHAYTVEPVRMIVGFIIIFAYINPRQVVETKRINTVINLWRLIGLSIFFPGLLNSILALMALFLGILIPMDVQLLMFLLGSISNYFIVILTIYLALRYPEFLLVSEAQVLRLCRLYTEIQLLKESSFEEKYGFDHIKEYIQSVPMAVFEDHCPEIEE